MKILYKCLHVFTLLYMILHGGLTRAENELINGELVDLKDWPATVYSQINTSFCSSNIVGERTLLIAAHCAKDGDVAHFDIGDEEYSATCMRSPDYKGNITADWALCLIDHKVEGIPYERINVDESKPKVGDSILLMGFGCTSSDASGGNDGTLRSGESSVVRTPQEYNYDIVTENRAALCYGDSGGPAWIFLDEAKTVRAQISVNSRGDIVSKSYLVSLANPAFKKFAADYSSKTHQKICGINRDAEGCR